MSPYDWLVGMGFDPRDFSVADGNFQLACGDNVVAEARRLAHLLIRRGVFVAAYGKRRDGEVTVLAQHDPGAGEDEKSWIRIFNLTERVLEERD